MKPYHYINIAGSVLIFLAITGCAYRDFRRYHREQIIIACKYGWDSCKSGITWKSCKQDMERAIGKQEEKK